MTTYADILKNSAQIIDLVVQFKYSDKVKIKYDLPDDDCDDAIDLYFIISEIDPNAPTNLDNDIYLSAKLSELLNCEANVTVEQRIPTLGRYDVAKKSRLLTDETGLKEVIYRVQNAIPTDETVEESSLLTIDFKDIVCNNFRPGDLWLQKGLLSFANKYLEENKIAHETPTNPTAASSTDTPKKNIHTSNSNDPNPKKAKTVHNEVSTTVTLTIPPQSDLTYDDQDEITKDYLARIS